MAAEDPDPPHAGSTIVDIKIAGAPARPDIFLAAAATTRMPMIVTDPRQADNPIVFATAAFLTLTGYAAAEIIGANCRILQGPETDAATVAELRRAIAERREHATEILNYRKDGGSFWNALSVSPVFDEAGALLYFVGSQLDVSRRRAAEEALREAERMEALGRLTGGIAHDFNNLLQVMVGYIELIDSGLRKPEINVPKLQRGIANARGAADRATGLTQQLLAFSRQQRLEGRAINLNDIVGAIRELAGRALGDDVTIETRLAADLPDCRVDPARVEMALLNILLHARAAMEDAADKRVTIETTNLVVDRKDMGHHHNLAPGRYCLIAVSDSGAARAADAVERLMDPFFTPKDEGLGTGLGLSLVYGFVKQSGGLALMYSIEGIGTNVRLYFPAVAATARPPGPAGRRRALDRPGDETILMVEGRADIAELARTILEDLGYTLIHAPDAAGVLARLDALDPVHLLLAELVMPGVMDGVALAREARRRRPGLKVLLTTGYSETSRERTDVGGSEFDVLNKPYGRSELARKVRVILDGPTGAG